MNFEDINTKQFNDKTTEAVEKMIVLKAVRIKAQGATSARAYYSGEKVEVSGMTKKELYLLKDCGFEKDLPKEVLDEIKLKINPKTSKK